MVSNDEHKHFSLWAVLTIASSVFITGATGSWIVGRTLMQDQLNQYEKSKNWNLPENIESLGKLSKAITISAKEKEEITRLRKTMDTQNAEIEKLRKNIASSNTKIFELQRRLQPIEGKSIELKEGETIFFVPGKLALTIQETSPGYKHVTVQFGSESKYLSQAEPMSAVMDGKKYTIIPIRVTHRGATFSVDIIEK